MPARAYDLSSSSKHAVTARKASVVSNSSNSSRQYHNRRQQSVHPYIPNAEVKVTAMPTARALRGPLTRRDQPSACAALASFSGTVSLRFGFLLPPATFLLLAASMVAMASARAESSSPALASLSAADAADAAAAASSASAVPLSLSLALLSPDVLVAAVAAGASTVVGLAIGEGLGLLVNVRGVRGDGVGGSLVVRRRTVRRFRGALPVAGSAGLPLEARGLSSARSPSAECFSRAAAEKASSQYLCTSSQSEGERETESE